MPDPLESAGRAARSVARATVLGVVGAERRIVRTRPGQLYISVRGLDGPRGPAVARDVERALNRVRGVKWAQVNPILAAVVVSCDEGRLRPGDLARVVGAAESAQGSGAADRPEDVPEHPADPVPMNRVAATLAADAVGMGVGVAARVLRAPALPVEIAGALAGVDSFPPARRVLDRHPGAATAAAIMNAAMQGLGQGPLGLLVDGVHRGSLLAELDARRRSWLAAEERLCGGAPAEPVICDDVPPRPGPLPSSLAERYAEGSSLASLAAAGIALAATRSARRTADVLLAGVPRAAGLGVEAFAAQVDRTLSARGVVVMDPSVLRRLDVVDTVVVDAPLLDDPAAAELVGSIREAAHDLVLAGGRRRVPARADGGPEPDLVVTGGSRLAASIRSLQAEGRVVALVSHRYGGALRAADLGIGVYLETAIHPPCGADVICMDLETAPSVVDATRLARVACRQAAALSATGSVAAALVALGPLPGAGRRAVTAVQLAALAAVGAGTWTAIGLPPVPERRGQEPPPPWHALGTEDVMMSFGSGPSGLSDAESASRVRREDAPEGPSLRA